MDEIVTTDLILEWLETQIKRKQIVDAHTWIDACQKLNILLGIEHDKLFHLQQEVAKLKVMYLEQDKSVAEARTRVEASDLYKEMLTQKARIDRINEAIRISKIQARLKDNEYRQQ